MTYAIIAVTVIISVLAFQNHELFEKLKHSPFRENRYNEYWRLLTSGFVHGSWLHLGINMFVFYSFGQFVEGALSGAYRDFQSISFSPMMGHIVFLILYLLTVIIANLNTLIEKKNDTSYGAIGASGAVSGVLFCSILFTPWEKIYLYGIIAIPSIIAGVGFLIYSQYAANKASDNIDHSAHFYGALAMPALLLLLKPNLVSHFIAALQNDFPF